MYCSSCSGVSVNWDGLEKFDLRCGMCMEEPMSIVTWVPIITQFEILPLPNPWGLIAIPVMICILVMHSMCSFFKQSLAYVDYGDGLQLRVAPGCLSVPRASPCPLHDLRYVTK